MAPKKKAESPKMNAAIAAAGPVVSRNEAMKIADSTGKSTAQVMSKAVSQGAALGAALVNSFNSGKLGANLSNLQRFGDISYAPGLNKGTASALEQLQALQGLQMNKGTAYAGYSTTTTPGTSSNNPGSGYSSTPGSTTYNPIVLPRSVVTGVQRVPGSGNTTTTPTTTVEEEKKDPYQAWLDSVNASNQAIIDSVNKQIESNASQAQLYMGQIEALMAEMSKAQQQPGGLASLTPYAVTTTTDPAAGAKLTTAITARKKPSETDLSISPMVGNLEGTGLNIAI